MKQVCILGATGSIGLNTLDVIGRHPDRFQVFALTAKNRIDLLLAQCQQFMPEYAVVIEPGKAEQLTQWLAEKQLPTKVLCGEQGLCEVASHPDVDVVMAAIVGAAGLLPTMAAVNAGKKILLANKEALVMAGALFMQAVESSGAQLLPIDSEHNAIFQCMPETYHPQNPGGVRKILLTGSGGPFRSVPLDSLEKVTVEQACNHPNWNMGRKISVDSATMMNKGLELIEACWLFGVSANTIEIVIHPQSIVHSMVEYLDGSVLAQMGNPDMRTPIAHALAWPERIDSGVDPLDLVSAANLEFQHPDLQRFPCLSLAIEAAKIGKSAPIVLNAANEIAVENFIEGQIGFTDIAKIVENVAAAISLTEPADIESVIAVDTKARSVANNLVLTRSY